MSDNINVQSQLMEITKLIDFKDYFLSFYDEKTGIYPTEGINVYTDILPFIHRRLLEKPNMPFDGDSLDREIIRSMILGEKFVL